MGVAGMKEHTPRGCGGGHLRGVCFGGRETVGAYDEHGAAHEGARCLQCWRAHQEALDCARLRGEVHAYFI